jgi:hypothetical protein
MVKPSRRTHAPHHLGVALSATELCVAFIDSHSERSMRRSIEPPPTDSPTWPSLARALAELKTDPGGARLSISLMPPLAEVRAVDLPPLRDDEAERVLMRSAPRYFVTARQPQIVGIVRGVRRAPRSSKGIIAAAAPTRLIAAIRLAARDAGFEIDGIGPAESAWVEAATSLWPSFDDHAALVVVSHQDRTDLLRLESGRLAGVRRFRPAAADADLIAEALKGGKTNGNGRRARIAAIGSREERTALLRALSGRGISPVTPDERRNGAFEPDVIAAEYAAPTNGPTFRTDDARVASRTAAWRSTSIVAAAAVVLMVAGAAVRLWGVHRQLDEVRRERERLAPRLSATLIGRTSVEAVYKNVAGLNGVEHQVPSWAQTIASLTDALPDASYLTAFRTRGDSLIVEGLAEQASDVFNAMEQLPTLANVRAGAPVRRELQDDNTPLERFTIVAIQIPQGSVK